MTARAATAARARGRRRTSSCARRRSPRSMATATGTDGRGAAAAVDRPPRARRPARRGRAVAARRSCSAPALGPHPLLAAAQAARLLAAGARPASPWCWLPPARTDPAADTDLDARGGAARETGAARSRLATLSGRGHRPARGRAPPGSRCRRTSWRRATSPTARADRVPRRGCLRRRRRDRRAPLRVGPGRPPLPHRRVGAVCPAQARAGVGAVFRGDHAESAVSWRRLSDTEM